MAMRLRKNIMNFHQFLVVAVQAYIETEFMNTKTSAISTAEHCEMNIC